MSSKVALLILAALASLSLTHDFFSNPAHAGDECQVAPNSTPPSGSHWYYRLEHSTERKCWYLGPEGREVRSAPAKVRATVKRTAPAATSVADEQPKPSEEVEEPPMPAPPSLALSAPTNVDAMMAQTSDPRTTTVVVQDEKFATDFSVVQAHSTTEPREIRAKTEPQLQRHTIIPKDSPTSGIIRPALLFVFVPAGFALAYVLVAIFPPPFRRLAVQVDRGCVHWDVENKLLPTNVKSALSTPDQPAGRIELPDDLKSKLRQVLQSLESKTA
jgi:hypothetical protein